MSKVTFKYKGNNTTIQCEYDEKMSEILNKFKNKGQIDINKVYFLYNGENIKEAMKKDEDIKIEKIINKTDKERNEMIILVNDLNEESHDKNIIKAKEVICPECKESIKINIDNYEFNLNNCINKHNINNILFDEFEKTQNIDVSSIKCKLCDKNKSNSFNNELFICLNCNINLCPLCKYQHEKEYEKGHKMINYELKDYICNNHYQNYIKYCKECNKDICIDCEKEHKEHEIIYYGDIIPKEEIKENINNLKEYIDKFNNEINNIINKLKIIMNRMRKYYDISNNIINNYKIEYKNYTILNNINEFIKYNNKIKNDIKLILNEDIANKFQIMNNRFNYIFTNNIIGEIKIEDEDINKEIQIINHDDSNKKEIEEKCTIKINNEIIPFSFIYKFKQKGIYIKFNIIFQMILQMPINYFMNVKK